MNDEIEPWQQPVGKAVGRPASPRLRLWQVEQLARFAQKFTHESIPRTEPDAVRIRKVVGRPGARRH
jgi:hypothetical protein